MTTDLLPGVDGVTFRSHGSRLLGTFYRGGGSGPRPTVVLLHGTPGIEKHLDVAYRLRDLGWNCLCFHFRGSWGSEGSFSFTNLVDDAREALEWALDHPAVDRNAVAMIGGAMGEHAALLLAANDERIRAVASMCPIIDANAFRLSQHMADEFAPLLKDVAPPDLMEQWNDVVSLAGKVNGLKGRPVLLVTTDADELLPPAHYEPFVRELPHVQWVRTENADHAFSSCRPWLVDTVTGWVTKALAAER